MKGHLPIQLALCFSRVFLMNVTDLVNIKMLKVLWECRKMRGGGGGVTIETGKNRSDN